tara:strand:+ start:1870 stop:2091 length:222 start_codon:yes stop_codon:yes gene_type:complete
MVNIQDDIKSLQNYESFARFMGLIHSLREETISELHEAPSDKMQQISGRILTYDQMLQMCDWEKLQTTFKDRM